MLRVIQLNALEDRSVNDKQQWDAACKFLEDSVKEKLQSTEGTLRFVFVSFMSIRIFIEFLLSAAFEECMFDHPVLPKQLELRMVSLDHSNTIAT